MALVIRFYGWVAGCWCSVLQMSLVYGLSFLWSGTLLAYTTLLLCWFAGSTVGVWLPAAMPSRRLMLAAYATHVLAVVGLLYHAGPALCWLAGLAGGLAGGHWVRRWTQDDFRDRLAWQSLGLASGFLLCSVLIYPFGLALIWAGPAVATLLVWRLEIAVE